MRATFVACLLAVCTPSPVSVEAGQAGSHPAQPRFAQDAVATNEGHATLSWSLPAEVETDPTDVTFELEQSRDRDFTNHRLRYRGSETAFFVSGLSDGSNYFRVRTVSQGASPGRWSEVLVVEVDYPGRGQVLALLAIGGVALAGTVVAILLGWLRTQRDGVPMQGADA